MGRKSETPVEKRVEYVLPLLRKEEAATQIARRAGVSQPTLYRWRDAFFACGTAQLAGRSAVKCRPTVSPLVPGPATPDPRQQRGSPLGDRLQPQPPRRAYGR